MYYIYMFTNKINNKKYVGQTISIDNRIKSHCQCKTSLLGKAIKEFGIENFDIKILKIAQTKNEANKLETFYIKEYQTVYPNGYNKWDARQPHTIKGKEVYQYDLEGNFKNKYTNVSEASQLTQTSRTSILGCIAGTYKKANNFIWLYEEQLNELQSRVENVSIAKCKIIQYDENWNEIARYNSCSEAERKLGLRKKAYKVIYGVLDKNWKAYGYYWRRNCSTHKGLCDEN